MDKRLNPVKFSAPAVFAAKAAEDDTTPRKFSGIAYSGGAITDHPFFPRVAFDLSSTKLSTPAPALLDHYKPVGVIKAAAIDNDIRIDGELFSDLEGDGKNIASMADRGMPWQMSVGIWPGRVEQVKAGAKVKLNGQEFEGPLTVFRDNRVREVSFCPLGADDRTSAEVFSIGGERRQPTTEDHEMDQAEHDRVVKEITDKFAADLKVEQDKVAALEAKFSAHRDKQRTTTLEELATARGEKFDADKAKPYLSMTDEQFETVVGALKASAPKFDPALGREHATDGNGAGGAAGAGDLKDPVAIQAAASKYMKEQADQGREVSVADAVHFVTRKAA